MGLTVFTPVSSPTISTVGERVMNSIYSGLFGDVGITVHDYSTQTVNLSTSYPTYPTVAYEKVNLVISKVFNGVTWYIQFQNDLIEFNGRLTPKYFISRIKYRIGKAFSSPDVTQCSPYHWLVADWVYVNFDSPILAESPKCTAISGSRRVGILNATDILFVFTAFDQSFTYRYCDGVILNTLQEVGTLTSNLAITIPRSFGDGTFFNANVSQGASENLSLLVPDGNHETKDQLVLPYTVSSTQELVFAHDPEPLYNPGITNMPRVPVYTTPALLTTPYICKHNGILSQVNGLHDVYHDNLTESVLPDVESYGDVLDPSRENLRVVFGLDNNLVNLADYSVGDTTDSQKKFLMWPNPTSGGFGSYEYIIGRYAP